MENNHRKSKFFDVILRAQTNKYDLQSLIEECEEICNKNNLLASALESLGRPYVLTAIPSGKYRCIVKVYRPNKMDTVSIEGWSRESAYLAVLDLIQELKQYEETGLIQQRIY